MSRGRVSSIHVGLLLVALLIVVATVAEDSDDILNQLDYQKFTDCDDVRNSGRYEKSGSYRVFLNTTEPLEVYCLFHVSGTYTSIMQQKYGTVSFYRPWADYSKGFGSAASGDYWGGLQTIKKLTDSGYTILTVTLQDWNNVIRTIRYNYFKIGPSSDRYRLYIGGYVSSAILPDDFSHNNGMPFATYDNPDINKCAVNQKAGWWYNYCTYTLPTGRYYIGGPYVPPGGYYDGIYYNDWHGFGYSLKYIRLDLSNV